MSRGFYGTGGGGGDSKRPGAAKSDPTKKKSMMNALNYSRNRQKTQAELVRERSTVKLKEYSEMVEDLLDAKMTSKEKPRGFNLPGSAPPEEKQITKGRETAIEHFKMKRMKQRMKVRDQRVEVIPKNYTGPQGGWIDKKGRIRNSHGQIVMEVNTKNGVISNRFGMKVGKYNPHSQTNDFKIQRLIQRYTQHQHRHINPFGGADQHDAPFNPFGAKP